MTYVPEIRDYQQLRSGDPHGGVNCTAYSAAILVDAHTGGIVKTTGRKVRAATDEPIPDPKSPGLNLPQVDAAVRKLTKIDFDTRLGDSIEDAKARILEGRWAEVQVIRGVIVDHGFGGTNGFRGPHAITVHVNPGDDTPVIGDPLTPFYVRAGWPTIVAAAAGIAGIGRVNAMFSRDVIPQYRVHVAPTPPHQQLKFYVFHVKGDRIIRRELDVTKGGIDQPCTPPRWYPWKDHAGRSLVRIEAGARKGLYVRSFFAEEVQ